MEKSARTIDEAINLALTELGLSRDQVTVDVLEEPSKGFFGIGSRQATVIVRYQEPVETVELPRLGLSVEPPTLRTDETADKPARLKALAEQICTAMGAEVEAVLEVQEERLQVDIKGPNAGMLIGHHGQTLDALQLLLNLAGAKIKDDGMRVQLDIEGYRKRREETLIRLATSKAEQVHRSGRRVVLEPMTAQERRIVHMALQDHPRVATESEGEEPFRRVVILPR